MKKKPTKRNTFCNKYCGKFCSLSLDIFLYSVEMTAKLIGSFGNVEQQQSLSQGSNKHVTTCPKWNIISKKQ